MPTNFPSFASSLDEWEAMPDRRMLEVQQRVARLAIQNILKRTPIDTGRLIENWQITIGIIPTDESRSQDPLSEALFQLGGLRPFEIVYITNNTPYAEVVEHGRYVDAFGSPANGPKTVNGFSTQSPEGMVRVTVLELEAQLR